MLLVLLVACGSPKISDSAPPAQEELTGAGFPVTTSPSFLDFGEIGDASSAVLQVTNAGEDELELQDVKSTETTLSFDLAETALAPGASTELTATWGPPGPTNLDTTLRILGFSPSSGYGEVSVRALGTASWPVVDLSLSDGDFGLVNVGCAGDRELVITNDGTEDLVISEIALDERVRFDLAALDDDLASLPWTLAPGDNRTLSLSFTPITEERSTDLLHIVTNDPLTPEVELSLSGEGHILNQHFLSFDVEELQAATVIFALNEVATTAVVGGHLNDEIDVFFDAMLARKNRFRVTFIEDASGKVYGDIPYIDETMTTDEAVNAFEGMISGMGGDNDYLLNTFLLAIGENEDWLLDESVRWKESRLTMVAINSDTEQSTGNATVYVNSYLTYKEDPEDIVVSAISGDVPRGCSNAEPAALLAEAAEATAGTFYSYCVDSWADYLTDIAEHAVDARDPFYLEGEPAAWSIEVSVNSVPTTEGWVYNADEVAIEFDDDHYPEVDSIVRVSYIEVAECDE